MKVCWSRALLVLAFLIPCGATAIETGQQEALEQIEARLETAPQMLGRFEQRKALPQLPRPLVSTGVVALSSDRGFSWRVQQPIESHLILKEGDATGAPMAGQLAYPLLQIFRGDFSGLDSLFYVSADAGAENWQVTLKPRSAALANVISSIEVQGNSRIRAIRLAEANSATTEMELLELIPVDENDPQLIAEFNTAEKD